MNDIKTKGIFVTEAIVQMEDSTDESSLIMITDKAGDIIYIQTIYGRIISIQYGKNSSIKHE